MTSAEAREILEKMIPQPRRGDDKSITHLMITEALTMAIKALEQEPCEDCISREAVIDLVADFDFSTESFNNSATLTVFDFLSMGQVVKGIYALPPVTPKAKTGKWIDIWDKNDYGISIQGRCNRCKRISDRPLGKFCKWCGAKMESEEQK